MVRCRSCLYQNQISRITSRCDAVRCIWYDAMWCIWSDAVHMVRYCSCLQKRSVRLQIDAYDPMRCGAYGQMPLLFVQKSDQSDNKPMRCGASYGPIPLLFVQKDQSDYKPTRCGAYGPMRLNHAMRCIWSDAMHMVYDAALVCTKKSSPITNRCDAYGPMRCCYPCNHLAKFQRLTSRVTPPARAKGRA